LLTPVVPGGAGAQKMSLPKNHCCIALPFWLKLFESFHSVFAVCA